MLLLYICIAACIVTIIEIGYITPVDATATHLYSVNVFNIELLCWLCTKSHPKCCTLPPLYMKKKEKGSVSPPLVN